MFRIYPKAPLTAPSKVHDHHQRFGTPGTLARMSGPTGRHAADHWHGLGAFRIQGFRQF